MYRSLMDNKIAFQLIINNQNKSTNENKREWYVFQLVQFNKYWTFMQKFKINKLDNDIVQLEYHMSGRSPANFTGQG